MNLLLEKDVETTPTIDRTRALLDPYFEGYPTLISSGKRTAEHQLAIIVEKILKHGISKLFYELDVMVGNRPEIKTRIDGGESFFWWQRGWSKLLNIGEIINPPIPAEVLFDYWRPGDPQTALTNKKGRIIPISNHQRGHSFDLGGSGHDLGEIEKRVKLAIQDGKCFIAGYLRESATTNNALHVDCVPFDGMKWPLE